MSFSWLVVMYVQNFKLVGEGSQKLWSHKETARVIVKRASLNKWLYKLVAHVERRQQTPNKPVIFDKKFQGTWYPSHD